MSWQKPVLFNGYRLSNPRGRLDIHLCERTFLLIILIGDHKFIAKSFFITQNSVILILFPSVFCDFCKKSAVNVTRTSLQVNTPTKTFGLGKVSFNEVCGVIS